MTEEKRMKAHAIIHGAAVLAAGAGSGMAQIPLSDRLVITPIQIGMIISLGRLFDRSLSESQANTVATTAFACHFGRSVSQVLLGWLPGFGNVLNGATAFSVTEMLGWYVAEDFDKNRI